MKIFALLFSFALAIPAFATQSEMEILVKDTDGNMYAGQVPEGYRSVKLSNLTPQGELRSFLSKTIKAKNRTWRKYVYTSGEYDHVSSAERRRIAADPLGTLEVAALLEVEEAYAIYKGNTLIGYYIQINDWVQSTIYQDGAWYDVFTEADSTIVEALERSA